MNTATAPAPAVIAPEYQEVNGTFYHKETPRCSIDLIEEARRTGARVALAYGDVKTGQDWGDRYDIFGKIGRSMGPVKIPLLIKTRRSLGGGGILDHCIVRLKINGVLRYQHPEYKHPSDFVRK